MSITRLVLFLLAAATLLAALAMPIVLAALRRRTGFTFERDGDTSIVASDVGLADSLLLRHPMLGICGKPDYLMERRVGGKRVLIPLEVKPTRRSLRLYDSDRIQIGAYLVALRDTFADRASPVGYVRYASQTFEVALTPDLERELEGLAAAVRRGRSADTLHRTHNIRARCRACAVREHCDEVLAE